MHAFVKKLDKQLTDGIFKANERLISFEIRIIVANETKKNGWLRGKKNKFMKNRLSIDMRESLSLIHSYITYDISLQSLTFKFRETLSRIFYVEIMQTDD